jgi:hypothetical protein
VPATSSSSSPLEDVELRPSPPRIPLAAAASDLARQSSRRPPWRGARAPQRPAALWIAADPPARSAGSREGGGHGGPPRRLHATETSTPPWKSRAGRERAGEARTGRMGGASLAGSAGARSLARRVDPPWIWWRRKQGGEEGERERVVRGWGLRGGEGDKQMKWARMVGMKERFKG